MIAATERSNKELVALLQEPRNMLNTRFGQISGSLANLEKKIDVAQAALLRSGDDFYTAYSFYENFLAPVLSRIAVDKRALAYARRSGRVRDVEYLKRLGRSRSLHYVSEAVPDPDSVAAARINAARIGKVGLAYQNRGRRVGYVEDLEGASRSPALSDVGVVA